MDTEMKQADISRGDNETSFSPFGDIFYSSVFFILEHLKLLWRPVNESRVENQVSFGQGEQISTEGVTCYPRPCEESRSCPLQILLFIFWKNAWRPSCGA